MRALTSAVRPCGGVKATKSSLNRIAAPCLGAGIIVQSEIWRNDALLRFSMGLLSASCKSADQGASTLVWAVVAQELEAQGGLHLVDCNVNETHPKGHDMAEAERLVALSEQLLDHVLGSIRPSQAASTGFRSTDGNL